MKWVYATALVMLILWAFVMFAIRRDQRKHGYMDSRARRSMKKRMREMKERVR